MSLSISSWFIKKKILTGMEGFHKKRIREKERDKKKLIKKKIFTEPGQSDSASGSPVSVWASPVLFEQSMLVF